MTTQPRLMRRRFAATAVLAGAFAVTGCAGPQLSDYSASQPVFDLKQYFNGNVQAHGLVSDRSGKVLRRFVVTLQCSWVGDAGTLDEAFVFSDGERQRRVWQLKKLADGSYTGTADDVVGQALGASSGSAFNWRYTLRVPLSGSVYELQFDDWMHQVDERTVINQAVMRKFGVRVGEITLSFTKP